MHTETEPKILINGTKKFCWNHCFRQEASEDWRILRCVINIPTYKCEFQGHFLYLRGSKNEGNNSNPNNHSFTLLIAIALKYRHTQCSQTWIIFIFSLLLRCTIKIKWSLYFWDYFHQRFSLILYTYITDFN